MLGGGGGGGRAGGVLGGEGCPPTSPSAGAAAPWAPGTKGRPMTLATADSPACAAVHAAS